MAGLFMLRDLLREFGIFRQLIFRLIWTAYGTLSPRCNLSIGCARAIWLIGIHLYVSLMDGGLNQRNICCYEQGTRTCVQRAFWSFGVLHHPWNATSEDIWRQIILWGFICQLLKTWMTSRHLNLSGNMLLFWL